MKRAEGFSLIELLVTLAILGFLLAAAIPGFSAWMANARIRSVAEALQNDLRKAQAEAVRRNHQTALVFTASAPSISATGSTTGPNWYIRLVKANANESSSDDTVGGSYYIGGETIASTYGIPIVASTSMVCFNSIGRPVNNGSTTSSPSFSYSCSAPSNSTTPLTFGVGNSSANASVRNLRVTLSLGGQVRMCDPHKSLSSDDPDGC